MILLLLACAGGPVGEHTGAPDSADADSAPEVECPPPEPWAMDVGAHAVDVVMSDCGGQPRSLHGLCGAPALVVNWYGWCASCGENAELARALADEHAELAVAIVLDEDPLSSPVDQEFCAAYEATYPSPAAVWMDPGKRLEQYGTTDLVLVLDHAGTLILNRQTATADTIIAAVESALGE